MKLLSMKRIVLLLSQEVIALRRQLMHNRLEATIKARAVMTFDQRKSLSERIKNRLQGMVGSILGLNE